MTGTEGKPLTCDLCGKTVILKYVNDGIRKHEDPPEGWGYWHVGDVIHSMLCPSCNERMQEALLACVGKIKGRAKIGDQDCVHCGKDRLVWDGDFLARDFGYEQEGTLRVFHCMACGARYEVFVPDAKLVPNKHELEWLMEKLIKFCDTQPTYEDVSTCVREFAPHFIRWSDGRDPDIFAGALED